MSLKLFKVVATGQMQAVRITDSVLSIGNFVYLGTDANCSISAQQSSVDHLRSHQCNAVNLMPA